MDCDSKGCKFESYYSPMFEIYNNISNTRINESKDLFKIAFLNEEVVFRDILKLKMWIKLRKKYYTPEIYTTLAFNLFKPKNQFFFNLDVGKKYTYSTGLIVKALGDQSRSIRRTKIGFNLFSSFITNKLNLIELHNVDMIYFFVNSLNNFNMIKNFITKIVTLFKIKFFIILKVGKNYKKKNYKKISYINKRIRKKYFIE